MIIWKKAFRFEHAIKNLRQLIHELPCKQSFIHFRSSFPYQCLVYSFLQLDWLVHNSSRADPTTSAGEVAHHQFISCYHFPHFVAAFWDQIGIMLSEMEHDTIISFDIGVWPWWFMMLIQQNQDTITLKFLQIKNICSLWFCESFGSEC